MSLKLREATENDIDFIQKYENIYFNKSSKSGILSEIFKNALIKCFILEQEKQNIGYTIIWLDGDKSQIYSLVIIPEKQAKGYAKVLLNHLFKYYKKHKIKEISLEVRISNAKAINLYKCYGFESVSIRKKYYNDNEDALLLYKKV
ncbi:MAG: ribosomal protein S18-alanine N-acetyltransferase [Bacillota bacterium]